MRKKYKHLDDHIQTKKTNYGAIGAPSLTFWNRKRQESVTSVNTSHTTKFITFKKKSPLQQNARRDWKRFFRPLKIMYRFTGKAYRVKFDDNVFYFNFHRSHPTKLYHLNNKMIFFKNKGFRLITNKSNASSNYLRRYIKTVRKRNVFNARGMWEKKSFFYKKKGKISAYR